MINLNAIIIAAARVHGIKADDITGRRRDRHVTTARREVMQILFDAGWSYPAIGRAIGGRCHTTAMYYLGAIKKGA